MTWPQNYDPLHSWPLSTLVSALPVLTLFFVLLVLRKRVWVAALCGMIMAIGIALTTFRMPALLVGSAGALGVLFGLLRIAWIMMASIFLYNVAVETGQFKVMKESIAALSSDRRLQLILIAFCFGAFLEGTGGGGAPVAIAGSFLIGLGLDPFQAATLCLLANTAPVAWGGVGTPIRVLAEVTGLSEHDLSAMTGRILPPLSAILPLWLVRSMVGWRATLAVWPALAVSGLSFALMQFYWSNFQDPKLVDMVAALFSLLVMVAFLRIWHPASLLEHESNITSGTASDQSAPEAPRFVIRRHSALAVLKGWSPFLLASVFIFLSSYPAISKWLIFPSFKQPMPFLHRAVLRVPPAVETPAPEDAIVDLNVLAMPGTAVFLSTVLAALMLGLPARRVARTFIQTLGHMIPSLLAISFMVGLAYVTRYSGMDTVIEIGRA